MAEQADYWSPKLVEHLDLVTASGEAASEHLADEPASTSNRDELFPHKSPAK
jgi:hypothetical protein